MQTGDIVIGQGSVKICHSVDFWEMNDLALLYHDENFEEIDE